MVKEIKADTQELLNDTSAIKQDTAQILAEIARLQEQLPRDGNLRNTSGFMLERYLDNLTSYAETVCDPFLDGSDEPMVSERGSIEKQSWASPISWSGSAEVGVIENISASRSYSLGPLEPPIQVLPKPHNSPELPEKVTENSIRFRDRPVAKVPKTFIHSQPQISVEAGLPQDTSIVPEDQLQRTSLMESKRPVELNIPGHALDYEREFEWELLRRRKIGRKSGFRGWRRPKIHFPENPRHVTHVSYDKETDQYVVSSNVFPKWVSLLIILGPPKGMAAVDK